MQIHGSGNNGGSTTGGTEGSVSTQLAASCDDQLHGNMSKASCHHGNQQHSDGSNDSHGEPLGSASLQRCHTGDHEPPEKDRTAPVLGLGLHGSGEAKKESPVHVHTTLFPEAITLLDCTHSTVPSSNPLHLPHILIVGRVRNISK